MRLIYEQFIFLMIAVFTISSCKPNLLEGVSSRSRDEYLLEEAIKANNDQEYDHAIYILTTEMSAQGQKSPTARETLSSSYAGKCGLNFIEYTMALAESTSGTAFAIMKGPFVGKDVSPENCILSLQTLDKIGLPAQRTTNQNIFAAITSLVLMGAAVRKYTDTTPANGDGTLDVNICTTVTNSQIEDIAIGFAYFGLNISYVSSDLIGGSSLGSLTGIINACSSVAGSACTVTKREDIDPNVRDTIRDLINTQEYGIGPYSTGGNDIMIPFACN